MVRSGPIIPAWLSYSLAAEQHMLDVLGVCVLPHGGDPSTRSAGPPKHGSPRGSPGWKPVDAILSTEHPLAGRTELRPADLQESRLWCPAAPDGLDFLQRFADHFGLAAEHSGANLGLDHLIDQIRADPRRFSLLPADPRRFSLLPADLPLPGRTGIRSVPLAGPTPLYGLVAGMAQSGSAPDARWLAAVLRRDREQAQVARVRPRTGLAACP
jgi:hypothetical protein